MGLSSIPASKVETTEGISIEAEIMLAIITGLTGIFFSLDFRKIAKEMNMKIGAAR